MQKTSIAALAAALLASPVAAGTPVLKERATSTLSPITITGNGQSFNNLCDRHF